MKLAHVLFKFAADSPYMIRPLDSAQMGNFGAVGGGVIGALGGGALGGLSGLTFARAGNRKRNALRGLLLGAGGGGLLGAGIGSTVIGGMSQAAHDDVLARLSVLDAGRMAPRLAEREYLRDLYQKAIKAGPTHGRLKPDQLSQMLDATPGRFTGTDTSLFGSVPKDTIVSAGEARGNVLSELVRNGIEIPARSWMSALANPEAIANRATLHASNQLAREQDQWPTQTMARALADVYSRR